MIFRDENIGIGRFVPKVDWLALSLLAFPFALALSPTTRLLGELPEASLCMAILKVDEFPCSVGVELSEFREVDWLIVIAAT